MWLADISAVAGDYEAAPRYGQRAVDVFREQRHLALQAPYGARLGRWLCERREFRAATSRETGRALPLHRRRSRRARRFLSAT
jgi:hypothetical protein